MGIGATLRLTVSYLKYIFVDGTFIDVDADTPLSAATDNIFPVSGREASFPVASPMKKPASQSQPTLLPLASAYSLLMACFMPLYTWLDVYRHRIPTGSALSYTAPFPRYRLFSLSLSLSLFPNLFPFSFSTPSDTASSSSKSSASSYESCDLIDRIASLPFDLFRLCSPTLSFFLSCFFLTSVQDFLHSCLARSHPSDELRCHNNHFVGLSRDLGYDSITS